MNHFIGQADENTHLSNYADCFIGSRIDVVLESEVFGDINYIPFHEAGLLKLNCDKALSILKWKATLEYYDTVRFTNEWYL